MIDKIEVPKNLMGSFKRVARRIPVDLKKDEELIAIRKELQEIKKMLKKR